MNTGMSDGDVVSIMTIMTGKLDESGVASVNRQTMVSLAERLIALAREGRPDLAEGCLEIDASAYTDPARFAAEKDAVFARCLSARRPWTRRSCGIIATAAWI